MRIQWRLASGLFIGVWALIGCGGERPSESVDRTGVVSLAMVNAPPDARCLQLTIAGEGVETRTFPLTPNQPAVFTVDGLPVGEVTLSEQVFTEPCASIKGIDPKWVSNEVTVELSPGVPVDVYFTLQLGSTGEVTVHTDFPDGGALELEEFVLGANDSAIDLISGPNDSVWFSSNRNWFDPQVGRITTSGAVTFRWAPHLAVAFCAGPDGNVWSGGFNEISKIPASGVYTTYSLSPDAFVSGLTTGPDGNVWFTDSGGVLGKMSTAGGVTEYALPSGAQPGVLIVGADGHLWATDWAASKIWRFTTAGTSVAFDLPSEAFRLAAGPDGNVWATLTDDHTVVRITSDGDVQAFAMPSSSYPNFIAAASDGNLWVGSEDYPLITRVTTDGVMTEFALPDDDTFVQDIVAGPDGKVWMSLWESSIYSWSIARFDPSAVD